LDVAHDRDPALAAAIAAPPGLRRHLAFGSLMLGHTSQGVLFTASVASLPMIALYFGGGAKGELVSAMTVSVAALGLMFGAIFSGRILELTGAWLCMAGSLAVIGLFGAAGLVVTDANILLASRFIAGFAAACLTTACIWVIAERYVSHERARVLGYAAAVASVAGVGATLLGGVLAQRLGWRAPFALFLVFAGLGLAFSLPSAPRVKPTVEKGPAGAGYAFLRRLWPFYVLSVFLMALVFLGSIQLPFLLNEDGIRSAALRSGILSATTFACAIVSALYGPVQKSLGPQLTFALSTGVLCAGLLTLGLGRGAPAAVAGAVGIGAFVGLLSPYLLHVVTVWAPVAERGRAIGVLITFNYLGAFANPWIFAPLRTAFGLHGMFVTTGAAVGLLTVGAVIRGFGVRPIRARLRQA
jgi:MFS family permease